MCRTRTCATSLIPSGRHGSRRLRFSGLDACCGRDGFVFGRAAWARDVATFFTFFGAAGRACADTCLCTVAGAGGGPGLAARSPEPPAQPAARLGTRTQLAAGAVAHG